jgi:DNA-directed RNA polymerase alpha subunit
MTMKEILRQLVEEVAALRREVNALRMGVSGHNITTADIDTEPSTDGDGVLPQWIPLVSTGLSVRLTNALTNADVITVGDLRNISERQVASLRNVGAKCVTELRKFTVRNGISMKRDTPSAASKGKTNNRQSA